MTCYRDTSCPGDQESTSINPRARAIELNGNTMILRGSILVDIPRRVRSYERSWRVLARKREREERVSAGYRQSWRLIHRHGH